MVSSYTDLPVFTDVTGFIEITDPSGSTGVTSPMALGLS